MSKIVNAAGAGMLLWPGWRRAFSQNCLLKRFAPAVLAARCRAADGRDGLVPPYDIERLYPDIQLDPILEGNYQQPG